MTPLANDLTKPRLTPPRVAGGAGQQHRARPPRRHHPLQVGAKWRRYFFFSLKPIKNHEARFCLYNIISSRFLQTAVLQVRCWGERGDDRAAGGGGQHAGGGARDQGAGGLQQIPLHLPPRHRGQDCTGQLQTVILCIIQFSNLIYTLNFLSFVNVKFQGSRSFGSVKRVYYNLIVQMFNQFRDTGLPS